MATEKVAVLGVSDMNPERDLDGQMVRAALALIRSGVGGLCHSPDRSSRRASGSS
jgi:hypothetical protein